MPVRIIFSLLLLWPTLALAGPTIHVSVNHDQIQIGDKLQVTVQMTTNGSARVAPPKLKDWQIVGKFQTNSYDSRQQANVGRLQLTLQPTRTGMLSIGPFVLHEGTVSAQSEAFEIRVDAQGSAKVGQAPNQAADPQDTPPIEAPADPTIFFRWEIDHKQPWVGQQIDARLYQYTLRDARAAVTGSSDLDLEGFWNQDMGRPKREQARLVQFGETIFVREVVSKFKLFPLRAGDLSLPAVRFTIQISQGRIRRRVQNTTRVAPAMPLNIRPLPSVGRPATFKGSAIGKLRVEAALDRSRIKIGESVQLTVTTRIEGLIHKVAPIELPTLKNTRSFPPTADVSTVNRGDRPVLGIRRQVWMLQPSKGGVIQIPAITVPYFDPTRARYATAHTRPLTIQVMGSAKAQAANTISADDDVLALRTIRTEVDLSASPSVSSVPAWLYLALLLPPLGLLGLVARDRLSARHDATAGSRAARKAAPNARRALSKAAGQGAEGFAVISHAIHAYLEARFGRPFQGMTHNRLRDELVGHDIPEPTVSALIEELENCDFARFAPGGDTATALNEAVARAQSLVDQIEEASA